MIVWSIYMWRACWCVLSVVWVNVCMFQRDGVKIPCMDCVSGLSIGTKCSQLILLALALWFRPLDILQHILVFLSISNQFYSLWWVCLWEVIMFVGVVWSYQPVCWFLLTIYSIDILLRTYLSSWVIIWTLRLVEFLCPCLVDYTRQDLCTWKTLLTLLASD